MLLLPQANAYVGSKLGYENDTLADRNSKSTQEVQNIQSFLGGVLKKTTMFIEELAVGKGGGQMPPAKALPHPFQWDSQHLVSALAPCSRSEATADQKGCYTFQVLCMENVALSHTAPRNPTAPAELCCPGTPHAGMGGLGGTKAVCARPWGSQGLLLACLCPGWWLRETRGVCNMRCTAGTSCTTTGAAKEALRAKAATKKSRCFYCQSVDVLMCQTVGRAG